MPIPIKSLHDNAGYSTFDTLDVSFLTQELEGINSSGITITASNNDADVLYTMWKEGETKEKDAVDLTSVSKVSDLELSRLKRMGFITVNNNIATFTEKGRKIVMTMVLCEGNAFEKSSKDKKYTEILASMDKRGKPGYRTCPKFASDNSNNLRF